MADQQQQNVVESNEDPLVAAIQQATAPTAESSPADNSVQQPNPDPNEVAQNDPVQTQDDDFQIQQREDGKYQLGRYVGDTVEAVAIAAAKGQKEAHAELTRIQQAAKGQQAIDPFAADEDLYDEDYEFEPSDPAASIRARRVIKSIIDDPSSDNGDFEQAAIASLQMQDGNLFQRVVQEWEQIDQRAAYGFQQRVEQAAQQIAQQQEQSYQAQQTNAFQQAQQVFVQQNPDWQQYDQVAAGFLHQNPYIMQSAYATGDPRAVYQAFTTAYDYARSVSGASAPVPAAQTATIEAAKDELHLESGGDGGGDLLAGGNDDALAIKKRELLAAMEEGMR